MVTQKNSNNSSNNNLNWNSKRAKLQASANNLSSNNTLLIPKNLSSGSSKSSSVQALKLDVNLDYLRLRNSKLPIAVLRKLIEYFYYTKEHPVQLLPNRHWKIGKKTICFRNKLKSKLGIIGGYNVNADDETVDVIIDLSGRYLERLEVEDILQLIRELYHVFKVHFCRIDIRIDDPSYSLIPSQDLFDSCQKGNVFFFRNVDQLVDEEEN